MGTQTFRATSPVKRKLGNAVTDAQAEWIEEQGLVAVVRAYRATEGGNGESVLFNGYELAQAAKNGFRLIVLQSGGRTEVEFRKGDRDGDIIAEGHSDCSRHDNFNRRLGLRIAAQRALKSLEEVVGNPPRG